MNNEEYIKKIQTISRIIENAKYVEDILNSKDIDIKEDFQYICLNSASNYDLVNEVIARLAQNGNGSIIEENIKIISMSTWKDLFYKNEAIKNIFINNFDTIYKNTSLVTYREIERFLEDNVVSNYIYVRLDDIIKKLCTYDRSALISYFNSKQNGSEIIKNHLSSFFRKGDFDISTAYAKVLVELEKTQGITKLDILKACNGNLSKMLSRETAIDNETNRLLSWIYDAFEETKMSDEDRAYIKTNIDTAILDNFQQILEKSNYDRETIKLLKQFDCTRAEFEKNKNDFIEKSHAGEIISYCDKEENILTPDKTKGNFESSQYCENTGVNMPDFTQIHESNYIKEKANGVSGDTEKVLIGLWSNIDQTNKIIVGKHEEEPVENNDSFEAIEESNNYVTNDEIYSFKTESSEIVNKTKDFSINEEFMKIEEIATGEDIVTAKEVTPLKEEVVQEEAVKTEKMYVTSKDLIDSYIKKYVDKSKDGSEISLDERLEKILVSNVEETNKIIEKVLSRNLENNVQFGTEANKIDNTVVQTEANCVKTNTVEAIGNESIVKEKVEPNTTENALIVAEQGLETLEEKNIFQKIWEIILKLFKRREGYDRIGE